MGSDANTKSVKSEQKQRLIIAVSLVAITAAFFLCIKLLQPPTTAKRIGIKNNNAARVAALTKAKAGAAVGNVRGGGDSTAAKPKRTAAKPKLASDAAASSSSSQSQTAQKVEVVEPSNNAIVHQKSEKEAATIRADLEKQVREIKATGVIMEADEHSLEMTGKLQEATRDLIKLRYGDFPDKNFRVKLDLEFQSTIPDFAAKGAEGSLVVELAPISLLPCSVYNFLEIARTWKKGAFHRNAGHVLQAISRSDITERMPFQEYHKDYPHKKGTMGYAGRPSGPEFYVSIQDNSRAHGPGSQQSHNPYEADCIIGTVIQGMEDGTVDRIHTMPGREFLGDKKKWVLIRRMHVMIPTGEGPEGYTEFSMSPLVIPDD